MGQTLSADQTEVVCMWFVTRDGKSKDGPFTWAMLQELLDSGFIDTTAMALAEGESKWLPIAQIQERQRANTQN
jgi:hypothetical protein